MWRSLEKKWAFLHTGGGIFFLGRTTPRGRGYEKTVIPQKNFCPPPAHFESFYLYVRDKSAATSAFERKATCSLLKCRPILVWVKTTPSPPCIVTACARRCPRSPKGTYPK